MIDAGRGPGLGRAPEECLGRCRALAVSREVESFLRKSKEIAPEGPNADEKHEEHRLRAAGRMEFTKSMETNKGCIGGGGEQVAGQMTQVILSIVNWKTWNY